MGFFKTITREPLVQFLLLGVVIYSVYEVVGTAPTESPVIEIGSGDLGQVFDAFSRTWQRPPTEAEFATLVDSRVKEEIFYREGQKMGLDKDDTVIRRRLQQKMEFLLEPTAEELTPKEGELAAYLDAHADKYRTRDQLAFRQIFFGGGVSPDQKLGEAKVVLAKLEEGSASLGQKGLGDPTLLPERTPLADADVISSMFGKQFTAELEAAPQDRWSGPIQSTFGYHLVFVEQNVPGHKPSLADVEKDVRLDWETDRRTQIAAQRYADVKKRYDVKIDWPTGLAANDSPTAAGGK